MEYDAFVTHDIDLYIGKPKSGKTMIAGSYPKPLLYIAVGNDGGGRVLQMQFNDDIKAGRIKVKNLRNDQPIGGKIQKTSIEKLAEVLAELRKPGADKFATIVIDTVGSLQDDYKSYMEFTKGGKALSQPEWGDVGKMMFSIKDNMKRFSELQLYEGKPTKIVWISHTRELEVYETSGLTKEIRIIPDLTVTTGIKFMKDASNIFYCCRKTVYGDDGQKTVKFLTYVGPHPLIDTGTRDMALKIGDFVEDFNYPKWVDLVKAGKLNQIRVLTSADSSDDEDLKEEKE